MSSYTDIKESYKNNEVKDFYHSKSKAGIHISQYNKVIL